MFTRSLDKASFSIMVPFFIFSFNTEINAQVKYVFHNKANLKLKIKYSIPRVTKKSVQIIKSNIIESNSTNNIKLSGVKIINNNDFKNELSNISSKKEIPTKVETTTISGVEIILGSNDYLASNNLKANKIKSILINKAKKPAPLRRFKTNAQKNNIDNEILFKDSPVDDTITDDLFESSGEKRSTENNIETKSEETTKEEIITEVTNDIVQKEVEPLETIEEKIESIEETVLEETTTKELAPESTNEIIQEELESLETEEEEEIESIEETATVETTKEEIIPESTNEIIQENVESLKTVEEEIESIEETATVETTKEEIIPESTNEIIQENVESLKTVEEEIESIEETATVETTKEELAPESTNEIIQEKLESLETEEEEIESIEESALEEIEDSKFQVSDLAKIENELAEKAVSYYTVRVKSVSNPTDGLKFLSEIKDNDAVWDEHTFHLFKDQENKNITNISIGKFVDKQEAQQLMEYLKTKNINNPSIEKYENKIIPKTTNYEPKKKSVATTKANSVIKIPESKVVINNETKKEVSSNRNLLENISSKVNESENYFSVQVGANNKISSTNIQGLNLNKEKLFFANIEQGKYAMNYGKHEDYGSAHKIALEIHKKGLETAFVTKYENGVRVKISKNDYLTDKTPKKTISNDINQLSYIPIGPNDNGKFIQIGTIYNWDAHNFKSLYDQLERTIYYKIKENNSVIFLVGPLKESEVFIELRTIKQKISDAFIKTL